jgi:hypothetical protein
MDPAYAGIPKNNNDPLIRKVPRTFLTTYVASYLSFIIQKTIDFF